MKARRIFRLLAIAALMAMPLSAFGDEASQRDFFETKIRPVLIEHCYECHSSAVEEPSGNLLLDSAAALRQGGDSGPTTDVDNAEESLLLEALRYELLEMPPAGRLPDQVIADFERWVEAGAFDPRTDAPEPTVPKTRRGIDIKAARSYWAFQPFLRHEAPEVDRSDWPTTDVDRFILSKLEASDLAPAPDAERPALVRRLYFDLTGLPPSPADVAEFLNDNSADAWERLVEQLLASREFGVHWGRHWLDVARYADSNGSDFNATFHDAWRYRDYVIDSFNVNKPFDQFVREQIAGDLLRSDSDRQRTEQIVATGFLMVGAKMLSERDKRKLTMDVVDEQINTVGQAFMGLTLGCARCHDHKFDPIPTRDYYALAGIFRSTKTLEGESQQYVSTWPPRGLPASEGHIAAVRSYEASKEQLQADIQQATRASGQLTKRLESLRAGEQITTLDNVDARLVGAWKASTHDPAYVGDGYLHDDANGKGEKSVVFTVDVPRDATYDVQLSYAPGGSRSDGVPINIVHAHGAAQAELNQRLKPPIDELFASVGRYQFEKGRPAEVTICTEGTVGHVIVDALRLVEVDDEGKRILRPPPPESEEVQSAQSELDSAAAELQHLQRNVEQRDAEAPPPLPYALAVNEADQIVDCEICIRGEHNNLGAVVPRGVLQVLAQGAPLQFPSDRSGRLELANWIASDANPLTARVIVNRIWHHLFGRGIVASVDNFGQLGDRPSHPALFDRLAADFVNDGWSVKQTIRRIVLSRTYRMSSRHDEHSWGVDPDNRLLWRANRRRLTAESIRDSMLTVSGEVDLTPGRSPVAGLGTLVTENDPDQEQFELEQSLRRSVYLPIIRGELPAILTAFDFADPDLSTGRRPITNVPAQALFLMNSAFVMQCAEKAAHRLMSCAGASDDPARQVAAAYELVLCRAPTKEELCRAEAFMRATEQHEASLPPLAQLIHTLLASTEFRMLN